MAEKKVCVVTWFGGSNFGTTLQATALCKWFESKGFDTMILGSFRPPAYMLAHPDLLCETLRCKIKYIKRKSKSAKPKEQSAQGAVRDRIAKYNKENFRVLNVTTNQKWREILSQKVVFVTGSDQIWNPNYYNGKYMLDFAYHTELKKIAFSSSIGVSEIPTKLVGKYKKYLGGFDSLSVREASAAELLEEVLGKPVKIVIDPTQLLDAGAWSAFADKADPDITVQLKVPYIFCYFVGDRAGYWEYVKKVQEKTKLRVVVIPMHGTAAVPADFCCIKNASAYEFVRALRDAAIVCTDSFHATAFSITFRKKLYILKRFLDSDKNSQNSRLYHILGKYAMTDRWIEDETTFAELPDTEYDKVHKILSKERQDAESFLLDSLKG